MRGVVASLIVLRGNCKTTEYTEHTELNLTMCPDFQCVQCIPWLGKIAREGFATGF